MSRKQLDDFDDVIREIDSWMIHFLDWSTKVIPGNTAAESAVKRDMKAKADCLGRCLADIKKVWRGR